MAMTDREMRIDMLANDGPRFVQLCAIRGMVRLETAGMRATHGSAYATAKRLYWLRGSRTSVLAQLNTLIEDVHHARKHGVAMAQADAAEVCDRCYSSKPVGQSCNCFDNNCQ